MKLIRYVTSIRKSERMIFIEFKFKKLARLGYNELKECSVCDIVNLKINNGVVSFKNGICHSLSTSLEESIKRLLYKDVII